MPFSKDGAFHLNSQRASFANKNSKPKMPEMPKAKPEMMGKMKEPMPEEGGSKMSELHDNGDGSFKTKSHDGEEAEHPTLGHALMHMAGKHAEGKHFHAHHDGGMMTTHHHSGMGVEGPNEHGSTEEAADHMKDVMGDGEQNSPAMDNEDNDMSMTGMGM